MSERVFYLYRHINLSAGEPFYIGVGELIQGGRSHRTRHQRAFEARPSQRNEYWLDLVKSIDYRVEILLESASEDYIYKKEIEFIALYGRALLGEGPLVNIARGGKSGKRGAGVSRAGTPTIVFVYDRQGKFFKKFETFKACAKYFKVTSRMISDQVRGRGANMSMKGYLLFEKDYGAAFSDFERYFEKITLPGQSNCIGISYLDRDMKLIKHFDSLTAGAKFYNIDYYYVARYAQYGRPDKLGNYWRKDGETKVFKECDILGIRENPPYNCVPVYAYKAETGELVGQYNSIREASRETNCDQNIISKVINKKLKKTKGMIFFKDDQGENIGKVNFAKMIGRYDSNRNLVDSFESVQDASLKTGENIFTIRAACKSGAKAQATKLYWKYIEK